MRRDHVPPSRDRRLADALAEFAHALDTDLCAQPILDRLVRWAADIFPNRGAGAMLVDEDGAVTTLAGSTPDVRDLQRRGHAIGQTPGFQALRTGAVESIADTRDDLRYPGFSKMLADHLISAVSSFPLHHGERHLGVLDLYRSDPGPMPEDDERTAALLAGVVAHHLCNAKARTEAAAAVDRLSHRSLHDPLTALPNRSRLDDLLAEAVDRARSAQSTLAVLFADLDGFKGVNDTYGHDVGDQLLIAVSARLHAILRPGDSLARLGGDEFVVVCENLRNADDTELVAQRITTALGEPFVLTGVTISITVSVGIAFSGPGVDAPRSLLRDADAAMYQAKRRGGGVHHILASGELRIPDAATRLRRPPLEQDLTLAGRRGQLALVYQPMLRVLDGTTSGIEALLRWRRPGGTPVPPTALLADADRTGSIVELGEWVLARACSELREWDSQGLSIPLLAVNVSPRQLVDPGFGPTVLRQLSSSGIDPGRLCLEITENTVLTNGPQARMTLEGLRGHGVTIALDDFGTGFSSISHLRQFPLDAIKIDGSLTAQLRADHRIRAVVEAVTALSHRLGLTVTAEGIETADQLAQVTHLGIDHAQGYLLSRPLSPRTLPRYLTSTRSQAG